jgi:hypothetical protein
MTVNIRPNFAVDPFSDGPVHLSDAPRVDHAKPGAAGAEHPPRTVVYLPSIRNATDHAARRPGDVSGSRTREG